VADPIRPVSWPTAPSAPARADPKAAAQRAFFEQALGRMTNPAPTQAVVQTAPTPPAIRPRPVDLKIDIPEAPPARIPRPGSILDIKV
jgi:hypothetical protein